MKKWESVFEIPSQYKLLTILPLSQGSETLSLRGGQGMILEVKNLNILGVMIEVSDEIRGDSTGAIILPNMTARWRTTCFGEEPMYWRFGISTESSACLVRIHVWSTWVPGMEPNPS